MKLFQGHFAAFLHFRFVFKLVFALLNLDGGAGASGFKFDFHTQVPMFAELVVTGNHETGDGDGVAILVGGAESGVAHAVGLIILEGSHHFAVAAEAPTVVAVPFRAVGVPLCGCCLSHGKTQDSSHHFMLHFTHFSLMFSKTGAKVRPFSNTCNTQKL